MPARAMRSVAMMPVGASGESPPAFAPLASIIAIRKPGMRARPAIPIATGASSAVAAMLPAPIVARPAASRKNTIGISPALPRASRTACAATVSSVPFARACANSSVMPTSVRNRLAGKPATIVLTGRPPRKWPIRKASAMESTPMLTGRKQLATITASSASSETRATFMRSLASAEGGLAPGDESGHAFLEVLARVGLEDEVVGRRLAPLRLQAAHRLLRHAQRDGRVGGQLECDLAHALQQAPVGHDLV